MTLIDPLGDIIWKARQAAGVSLDAAARAADLSPALLEQLERTGQCDSLINIPKLAPVIGLHAEKLARIATGWLPAPRDLTLWRELRVISTSREGLAVNSFLAWDEVSREGALFDTGWDAAPILELIDRESVILRHLFLTHTHDDHMAAMGTLRERFPQLRIHTNSKTAPPQHRNRANDCISLGSLRITNRDTPGHADDAVTYLIGNWPEDAPHVAVVGDTLFAGSIATPHQSADVLKQKIRDQILSLPADTLVCPGHGPLTTVTEERSHNPFF